MPVAALISAAASLGGAALQSSAANSAAKAQQQASQQNVNFENQVYGTAQNNLQPFVGYGQNAGSALQGLLGTGGNPQASQQAFQNYLGSTNYNFLLNQGEQAQGYLNAPSLYSGGTQKALTNYAQGMAGNALYPYENLLQNQEGLGVQAGSALGLIGNQNAGLQAQARNLAAGATGTAGLFGANAYGSALNGIFGGQSSYGSSGIANALSGLFGGGGGGGAPNLSNGATLGNTGGLDQAWQAGIGTVG